LVSLALHRHCVTVRNPGVVVLKTGLRAHLIDRVRPWPPSAKLLPHSSPKIAENAVWRRYFQRGRESATDPSSTTSGPGYWAPLLIAVALILAYLAYALLLYLTADDIKDEQHWSRLVLSLVV
jgi:hypothetical protein